MVTSALFEVLGEFNALVSADGMLIESYVALIPTVLITFGCFFMSLRYTGST